VIAVGGCGGRDPNKPPLGRVHGRVTYNGKPLTNGSVTFTPVAGEGGTTGQVAAGQLKTDGSYSLTTFDIGDGAIVGEHVVTVRATESNVAELNFPGGAPGAPPSKPSFKAKGARAGMGLVPYIAPKPLIPKKYMTPSSSPFRYTVEPGNNTINLELTD
jgi:hypothetical protein